MPFKTPIRPLILLIPLLIGAVYTPAAAQNSKIITYIADPADQNIQFWWKDDSGAIFGNIQHLKDYLASHHQRLVFAVNGGMFKPDYSPVGLFIRERQIISPLDTSSKAGNFYLKPNGVLYITTTGKAVICQTSEFKDDSRIRIATQSGPMLLIHGDIHPSFKSGSANLNIRNGVGLLPDNRLLFAMSTEPVNFYDFATYFKSQGCKEALYLDGFVSRTYLPEKNWQQTDGNLCVLIAVTETEKDP